MNNINGSKYIVEMVDYEKKINHNIILRKVTFRVGAGEICGIIGANGSGKSNFIDAISFVKNLVMNSIMYQPGQGIKELSKFSGTKLALMARWPTVLVF